jgi:hypothetical protein
MVEPGIESGTSWLVVRSSDHQTTRLVKSSLFQIPVSSLALKVTEELLTSSSSSSRFV